MLTVISYLQQARTWVLADQRGFSVSFFVFFSGMTLLGSASINQYHLPNAAISLEHHSAANFREPVGSGSVVHV
jgi:hypothetical protein